ncbi:unnamed protein product [Calypogeia fissa]
MGNGGRAWEEVMVGDVKKMMGGGEGNGGDGGTKMDKERITVGEREGAMVGDGGVTMAREWVTMGGRRATIRLVTVGDGGDVGRRWRQWEAIGNKLDDSVKIKVRG